MCNRNQLPSLSDIHAFLRICIFYDSRHQVKLHMKTEYRKLWFDITKLVISIFGITRAHLQNHNTHIGPIWQKVCVLALSPTFQKQSLLKECWNSFRLQEISNTETASTPLHALWLQVSMKYLYIHNTRKTTFSKKSYQKKKTSPLEITLWSCYLASNCPACQVLFR